MVLPEDEYVRMNLPQGELPHKKDHVSQETWEMAHRFVDQASCLPPRLPLFASRFLDRTKAKFHGFVPRRLAVP